MTCSRLFGAGNDGEIVYSVMEGQIPRPSELRADVPPELEAIVMRGLHKNPAERFQTAKDMSDALERAAPPVTRSTVSTWVWKMRRTRSSAAKNASLASKAPMTPVPATSLLPPAGMPASGDSTLSRMGSLSQSVTPDAPAEDRVGRVESGSCWRRPSR